VIEPLRATGAPFVNRADLRVEDVQISATWPLAPGDVGGIMSVRRQVLDPILADAATEAGAQVRTATKVIALREENGRVAGVRVRTDAGEQELHARMVVGADGRNSAIARLPGIRKYNVVPSQRAVYWGYFDGGEMGTARWAASRPSSRTAGRTGSCSLSPRMPVFTR